MAEEDERQDLHPRILLLTRILAGFSFLLLIGSIILIYLIWIGELQVGPLKNFILILLGLNSLFQSLDILSWYFIRKQTRFNNEKAGNILFIPVLADVILIFAFGLGALMIIMRIQIYGSINPDEGIYDDSDPLFQN